MENGLKVSLVSSDTTHERLSVVYGVKVSVMGFCMGKLLKICTKSSWRLFLIQFPLKGAVSYFTHMLLGITNLKVLGQRFQV